MPAPDHLRLILHTLGTGGTREMAERVHEHTAGLHRQIEGLTAQVNHLAQVLVTEFAATDPGETACDAAVRLLCAQAAEIRQLRSTWTPPEDDEPATEPEGDREDPITRLRAALADAGGARPASTGTGALIDAAAAEIRRLNAMLEPQRADIRDLIETFCTPDSVTARASVPAEVAQAAVARAAEPTHTCPRYDDHLIGDFLPGDHLEIDDVWGTVVTCPGCDAASVHNPAVVPTVEIASIDDEDAWNDEPDPTSTPPGNLPAEDVEAPPVAARQPSNDQIRDWCRTHGVAVSDRGPIGKTARHAYTTAHSGPTAVKS